MRLSVVPYRCWFHRRKIVLLSCVLAAWLASATSASAAMISIVPSDTNITVGESFTIDILITDVTDLNSFQLGILFDPAFLTGISGTQGTLLPSAGETFPFDPSFVFIDNFSGEILFLDGLVAPTGAASGSGTLLSLTFLASAVGTSEITIGQFQGLPTELVSSGVDEDGSPILIPFSVTAGSVTVSPATVPEPGTLLLLSTGFAASVVASRRRQRRGTSRH